MFSLDPKTTALVLIDLQQGTLAMPLAPYDGAQVVAAAVRLGQRFAEVGGTVVPVHVAFAENYADRPGQPTDQAMAAPAGGMPAGWSVLHPDSRGAPARRADHQAELERLLWDRARSAAPAPRDFDDRAWRHRDEFRGRADRPDAWHRNYSVVVAEDACTSVGPDLHRFSIEKVLPRVARVRSTAEIVAALQA